MQFFPFQMQTPVEATAKGLFNTTKSDVLSSTSRASNDFDSYLRQEVRSFEEGDTSIQEGEQKINTIWNQTRATLSSTQAALNKTVSKAKSTANKAASNPLGFSLKALALGTNSGSSLQALAAGTSDTSDGQALKALSSLKMTREDFSALQEGLRSYGLSEDDISALLDRIDSEGGLSWGQFMTALGDKSLMLGSISDAVDLTDIETRDLQALFQKIGFTPDQSEELLSKLQSGQFTSVWESISTQLASLPDDATIDISVSEMETLAKAMRLSQTSQAKLTGLLGGQSEASLSPRQLESVMTMLAADVAADATIDDSSSEAMQEVLSKVLDAAVKRAALGEQASDEMAANARNQKILSEHNRREQAREENAEKNTGQTVQADDDGESHAERILEADPNRAAAAAASTKAKDGSESETVDPRVKARSEAQAQARKVAGVKADNESRQRYNQSGSEAGSDSASDDSEDALKEMLGKIRVESDGSSKKTSTDAKAFALNQTSEQRAETTTARLNQTVGAKVLRQVEQGVLKNMGQGTKQLTLAIDPPELGKMHMVLQLKDNELTATFRAETKDGGRVLSEQLSQLRTHLENQGIKVAKMEVQTQLQGDGSNSGWMGADSHNAAQQRDHQQRRQGILRQLQEDSPELAQEMQIDPETARITHEGLDIVA